MKRFRLVFIVLSMLLSGCYDNFDAPPTEEVVGAGSHKIEYLREACKSGCHTITTDVVCVGRITSSDSEGNFYRSIVVEDASGGAEIKLGRHNTASQYPLGLKVELRLNGTAIMVENGVVQIGLPPQSFDEAPREMEAQAVIDSHIIRSNSVEVISPLDCTVATLNDSFCGRLVAIENLHYTPIEGEEEALAEGYHRLTDENGNTIFLYISPYADFAGCDIPTRLSVEGILYREVVSETLGAQFIIKPRR